MGRVLLSGFEPFGGDAINPTAALMKRVADQPADFGDVRAVVLPVSFDQAFNRLSNEIRAFDPDTVIAFGLAAGRSECLELERVAINHIDCLINDNDGRRLVDEPVLAGGENALFATLPLREMLVELEKAGVPARISNSAGAYVCNFLFYRLLETSLRTRRRAGFVHVPYLPEQGKAPSMNMDKLEAGLKALLKAL